MDCGPKYSHINRVANGQQIGMVVLAQFFQDDRFAREIGHQHVAERRIEQRGQIVLFGFFFKYLQDAAEEILETGRPGAEIEHGRIGILICGERFVGHPLPVEQARRETFFVVFLDPERQVLEIIAARHPLPLSRIEPESAPGRTAADYGRIRIFGNGHDFRFRIAFMQAVSQRGGSQVQRRKAVFALFAIQSLHFVVRNQVNAVVGRIVVPTFRRDSVPGRIGARRKRGESGDRIGLHVIATGIGEVDPAVEVGAEAVFREIIAETFQVFVPHLADNDIDH